jgi:hypothetical protein
MHAIVDSVDVMPPAAGRIRSSLVPTKLENLFHRENVSSGASLHAFGYCTSNLLPNLRLVELRPSAGKHISVERFDAARQASYRMREVVKVVVGRDGAPPMRRASKVGRQQ